MGLLNTFKGHYRRVKAEIAEEAKSFGRLVKNLKDTKIRYERKRLANGRLEPAKPIAGAFVRMLDKKPMQFFTDGSLRHVLPGMKPGKALRKALKRQRQRQRAESARRASMSTAA